MSAKGKQLSRFDGYSVGNSVLMISHITFWNCRVHFLSDNLSRNRIFLADFVKCTFKM